MADEKKETPVKALKVETVSLKYTGKAASVLGSFLSQLPGFTAVKATKDTCTFSVVKVARGNGMGNRTFQEADFQNLTTAVALLAVKNERDSFLTDAPADPIQLWTDVLSHQMRAVKRHPALSGARTMGNSTAVSHLLSTVIRNGVPITGSAVNIGELEI